MHKRLLWSDVFDASVLWLSCVLASSTWIAGVALAQTAPAAPPAAPPAAEPATLPPPGEPVTPPAATPTAPAEPPPPVPPPPVTPPPPPGEPTPQYGRLGGAQEQPVQEGEWNPWDHPDSGGGYTHEGFFLRLQLGPGGSSVSREGESWSGMGLGMGLAIGGSPTTNLALHLDLQASWLFSPDRDVNGIGMQTVGLGVTYYIMPVDIFLSGSAGIGWLAFEDDDGQSKDTSAGFALDAMIGKEWWVGSDWGIGVAGQFLFTRVNDYTDDEPMNAIAVNVLFTATYN